MDIDSEILTILPILRSGGIILYPTDTVWGIGCDASCSGAVRRIFALKRRVDSKAMLSLVGSRRMLSDVAGDHAVAVLDSIDTASRPTTVIFSGCRGLAPELIAPDGTAALRLTRETFSSRLCEAFGAPIVSTSANISGQPAAPTFASIAPEIIEGVDYVVSYRRDDTSPSLPSRIVMAMPDKTVKIIRP